MPDESMNVAVGEAAAEGVNREADTGNAGIPPAGGSGGKSPGRPRKSSATLPPADGDKPPPPSDTGNGKRRIKCEALKGKKVIVGKGEAIEIDEHGLFEVEEQAAQRLLSIPGYEEA